MSKLIEVPFEGGTLFFAARSDGPEAFSSNPLVAKAVESIEDVIDQVCKLGSTISSKLAGLDFAAAEVSLGMQITGKGKFIVAEASAEASLTFKLTFNPAKSADQ